MEGKILADALCSPLIFSFNYFCILLHYCVFECRSTKYFLFDTNAPQVGERTITFLTDATEQSMRATMTPCEEVGIM